MRTTFKFITSLLLILNVVTAHSQYNGGQININHVSIKFDGLFTNYNENELGLAIGIINYN